MTAERTVPAATRGTFVRSFAARAARVDGGELLFALATAIVPLVALVPVLRLWRMDLRVPFEYGADATFNLMVVRNLLDGGWVNVDRTLGAPFGQELYDFPLGTDNLNLLAFKLLGLVTDEPAVVLNVFYLLGYPAVALSAVLVLRHLGLSRPSAFLGAVLFALLPYHFWRGETHVLLSAYVAVPLGALLTLRILAGDALFERREQGRRALRWASRRTLVTLLLCAVIASTGLYYAFFTIVLVAVAAVVAAIARASRAILLSGATVVAALGVALAVNVAPSLAYIHAHGANDAPVTRAANESELFGLRLTQLLLPVDGHRLAPLARRSLLYDTTTPTPVNALEAGQTLGTIGDVGFLALVLAALVAAVAGARRRPPALLSHASAATIVALLFGITTGFATLFAYAVTPKFHAPGRISVFIAFFSLLAVAVLLDAAARRWLPDRRRETLLALAVVPLVVLGIADQTTNAFVPRWDDVKAQWRTESAFGASMERALPQDASVFELPYTPFPDNTAPGRMQDYDQARPSLHVDGVRWSYGAMKGRPEDWAAAFGAVDPETAATAAAAAGFDALYLDRAGYADEGAAAGKALDTTLGTPLASSPDGRFRLYDLRPYARALERRGGEEAVAAAGDAALHPVRLLQAEGFAEPASGHDPRTVESTAPRVRLALENPDAGERTVVLATTLTSADDRERRVVLTFPDGSTQRLVVGTDPVAVRRTLALPPGRSELSADVAVESGEPSLRWTGTGALDPALLRLERR